MTGLAVAGAGIGGLATALALARVGRSVTVLERRPGLAEFGAGLQLAPNATRLLADLGLLDAVRAVAVEPEAVRVRRGRDAVELARLPLGRDALARYGAPFLLVHRPDLQAALAEAVAATEVVLRFNSRVDGFTPGPEGGGVLRMADGQAWPAAGFVDARGWPAPGGDAARRTAWRALLPADGVTAADRQPVSNLWLGARAHLVHYPICAGRLINVVAITEARGRPEPASGDPWSRPGDPAELRQAFTGWHPAALRLLDAGAAWRRWPLFDGGVTGPWGTGPATRVGDAAHPMLPFLAQGASQAIEDAATLATALGRANDVASAFAAYERERRPRAARVQAASRRQGDVYHLGRPASDARDLAMRVLGGAGALARLDWLYRAAPGPAKRNRRPLGV